MENNFGFDYNQYLHMLSHDPNLLGFPPNDSYLNTELVHADEHFTSRNVPSYPVSGLQQMKASDPNNARNWFYLKPHFHNAFAPSILFDLGQPRSPMIGSTPAQKRFLVFDQSGDKTTLLFSPGVHAPALGAHRAPIPPTVCNLKEQRDANEHSRLSLNNENDFSRDGTEDEMHENTEELDALLCSDDDTYISEDDETSTGHSPSTMTDNGMPKLVEEAGEEVDSFSIPTKRQKLSAGGYNVQSLKSVSGSTLESHAESSCKKGSKQYEEELDSWSGRKRLKKERILKTVSILQSIVPNANGKDAVIVIDEAIQYLKSLKVKAKALGLDAV